MKIKTFPVNLCAAFLVLNIGTLSAQLTGGLGGGLAKFVGEGSGTFKSGLSLDGTVFYKIKKNIHVGS